MQIIHSENMGAMRGEESHFTGAARLVEILKVAQPNSVNVYLVSFEAGSRTAWHSHPSGQILCAISGKGRVVSLDDPAVQAFEVGPGDIVRIAPNEKHWHGAAPDNFLAHIAITPHAPGESTNWMEKVSDDDCAQYKRISEVTPEK